MHTSDTMAATASDDPASSDDPGGPSDDPASPDQPGHNAPIHIDIVDPSTLVERAHCDWLVEQTTAAMQHMGVTGSVRARLISDCEMAAKHLVHCGVPGTTDVITFDLSDGDDVMDVDLLVCVDEARRQSSHRSIAIEHELLLYVIHGMLHCLDYDDHTPDDAAAMHAREDEILTAIGVGPVYGRASS